MALELLASPELVSASKEANIDVDDGNKSALEESVYRSFSSNARSIESGRLESKFNPVKVSISLILTVQVDHNLGSGASGTSETGKLGNWTLVMQKSLGWPDERNRRG
jgi:hypothetical protein